MATYQLGNLKSPGGSVRPPILQQSTMNPGTSFDTFEFLTQGTNINLSITNISGGGNVNLSLFHDANDNGILDQNDTALGSSARSNQLHESLNINASSIQGRFFAQVTKQVVFGVGDIPVSYKFAVSGSKFSNLLPKENELGTISQDITRQGAVGNSDTTDVYSLAIKPGDIARIRLSKQGGNARLRLIEDRNQNQLIDTGDRVLQNSVQVLARSFSPPVSTNYLLQVVQLSGEPNYQLTFDHHSFGAV